MDIQSRKLEFIQEFLKLQSEEVISQFEKLLKKAKKSNIEKEFEPFPVDELIARIEKSEDDFKNGEFKSQEEIEKISENW